MFNPHKLKKTNLSTAIAAATICSSLIPNVFSASSKLNELEIAKNKPNLSKKPNIIYILADDMGYGDISYLNPDSKIKTPNIDSLGIEGISFTNAHSTSAICTPSRYSILTGRYNWRSSLKSDVLWTHDKHLIEDTRITIAKLLQNNGYQTAFIGKWHLGWNWGYSQSNTHNIDYSKPIKYSPNHFGFDYSYGIAASLDIPPYVYVENGKALDLPVRVTDPIKGKKFQRGGDMGQNFNSEEALDNFTDRALNYIDEKMKNNESYFLYFPLTAPHTPILPAKRFQGKSGTNEYGDFCLQIDDIVGRIIKKVEEYGMSNDTIILFTSDNGCSPTADFAELATFGHNPNYKFKGNKSMLYEGGHHIMQLIKYPALIKKGKISNQLVGQQDFFATVAELLSIQYDDATAEDSVSNLPLWLGEDREVRESLIHHSSKGKFSITKGDWKLILAPDSGGWGSVDANTKELKLMQLFNIKNDIEEKNNLIEQNLEIAQDLFEDFSQQVLNGRSTEGEKQLNNNGPFWQQLEVLEAK